MAAKKPLASGQIEPEEKKQLERLEKVTGRSQSYWVRYAVKHLLRDIDSGRINTAVPMAETFKVPDAPD